MNKDQLSLTTPLSAQMPMIHMIRSSLSETSTRVEKLEEKINSRSRKFTEYAHLNDLWKKKTDDELETIISKLNDMNAGIGKIEDYIKELELKKSLWMRAWNALQQLPKTLLGLIGAIGAFFSFIMHYVSP